MHCKAVQLPAFFPNMIKACLVSAFNTIWSSLNHLQLSSCYVLLALQISVTVILPSLTATTINYVNTFIHFHLSQASPAEPVGPVGPLIA